MDEIESLKHSCWECKYHVVFIPKGRKKALYGRLRKELGEESCLCLLQFDHTTVRAEADS